MKLLVSLTSLSLVSSFALANTSPAVVAQPTLQPAAQNGTKASMRVQIDPFYKNLNNANKNYKTPKLDTLRIMFERNLGQYSKADVELRLNELENSKKYSLTSDSKRAIVNSDVVKYYHLLFTLPGVDGLELGFVREMESALYGYTDKVRGSNVTESVAFTGHMNRIDGYRALYDTGWNDLKLTYHLARNSILNDDSLSTKPADNSTWYHKLTSDLKIDKTTLQAGFGAQGHWQEINSDSSPKSEMNYDTFVHLVAEQKIDDLKLKTGVAQDSYSTVKNSDQSAAQNIATTFIIGAKYDFEKDLSLLSEFNYRNLKSANADRTDYSSSDKPKVDSAKELSFTLAGQYKLDDKLSFVPSYSYYHSNRSQAYVDNSNGAAFSKETDRTMLKGSDGKAAQNEQALGLRIRYDY